jgi:hypothetical protein
MKPALFNLRNYQQDLAAKAVDILTRKRMVYLAIEVRCGKTLIALETCKRFGAQRVLFITKIKAFSSIQSDFDNFGYDFKLQIINKESIHKIDHNNFDVIIYDEAHQYGAYPKAGTNQKELVKRFRHIPCILMTGTATPESYSQIYHQLQLSAYSPFKEYINFYKWVKDFVTVKQRNLGYATVNDYSDANFEKIKKYTEPITLTYTQKEAGFETNVKEFILTVQMKPIVKQIITKLKNDLVVKGASGKVILADTGAKLQQKIHQLSSGTIKFEDGTFTILDNTKALFIAEKFKNNKIAIFYNFIAELEMLKQTFGEKITDDLNEFNNTDKWYVGQIVSSREGISLAKADYLVMFNIQFSAVSYFQSIDRMTTKDRKENNVFWIFSKDGIEQRIYKAVQQKKNYTLSMFLKDFSYI